MRGDDGTAMGEPADRQDLGRARRLDGNAAAAMLSEIFVADVTAARATCANCGVVREVGALPVYGYAMGMVMRCPDCDAVIMRLTQIRTHVYLDATGAKLLVVAAS